jgi:hypothetical protein
MTENENEPIIENDNIMNDILNAMSDVQKIFTDKTSKKMYVMRVLKKKLGPEIFQRYEPMISLSIDFIKTLTKNKSMLNGIKHAEKLCIRNIFSCTNI